MKSPSVTTIGLTLLCGMGALTNFCEKVSAQDTKQNLAQATQRQVQALLPDWSDLQGFTRVVPDGEPSGKAGSVSEDKIVLAVDMSSDLDGLLTVPGQSGRVTAIARTFYTNDTFYKLKMTVWIYDNQELAKQALEQFLQGCSTRFLPGTFSSTTSLGESSWYNPSGYTTLISQYGQIVMLVSALPTHHAMQIDKNEPFPTTTLESVAYQGLLRASQQVALTGVSTETAHLAVNGLALPKNALQVAGQTYVPVAEFAKAMGLTTQWDSKTGALTLSGAGRKTVTLTADSTEASVGGTKAALTVPVLKQDGQPVMTLDDLLTVTGGRITAHSGNDVQVKG